jgi:D-alanyl-D-alanine carboxypeptidase
MDDTINIAAIKRTAPPIIEGREIVEARTKDGKAVKVASAPAAPARAEPTLGSTEPIKPNPVKAFTVQVSAMRTASVSAQPSDSQKLVPAATTANPANVTNVVIAKREPAPSPAAKPGTLGVFSAKVASASDDLPVGTATPAAKPRGGWMIQVGAFPEEREAKQRLAAAQGKAKDQLGQASPFTERIEKGDKSLYRARFAGMDKNQAETACKHLKRSDIPCMLLRD